MISRIVKMTFRHEELEAFMELFESVKHKIRGFDGCLHLELMADLKQKNILYTFSKWTGEDALDAYRNSDLFAETWKNTKSKFKEKAEAWSLDTISRTDTIIQNQNS